MISKTIQRLVFSFGLSLSLLASESALQFFRNGLEEIKRGDFAGAEVAIKEGLKQDPTSPAAFDLLGIAYDGEGRESDAERAFRQAIALNSRFIAAYNDLGILLYRRSRAPEAIHEFLSVLALDPSNFTANYNLGIVARDSKRYPDAVKYLEAAHLLVPSDLATLLALVAADLGAARTRQADIASDQLLALRPADSTVQFSLGTLFLEWKKYEKAAQFLEQARWSEPNNYEVLHDLGQAYIHLKKYSEAENVFLKALTIRTDSMETLYQLAIAYAEDHQSDQAIQILVRARQIAPHRPDILLLLARECIQEGLWDDAQELLAECIALDKEKIEPHLLLGEAYSRAHLYDKALAEYKEIERLAPNNPQSFVSLGCTYQSLNRYPEAKAALEKALKIDAGNVEAAYQMGLLAEDQGEYKTAEGWFEQVLKVEPSNIGCLFELGNTHTREEDYGRARDYYERAAKASPTFPQTYFRLSVLYRRLKDPVRANAMFALFQTYQGSEEDKQSYHPHGVLTFLAQTQDLSESERLRRYEQELLHVAGTKPDDLNVLFMLAQIEFRLGNRDAARARIDQIIRLAPDDSKVRIRTASLLKTFQLHAQAADQLRNFLETHEAAEDIRMALASLYCDMRRTADAIQVLTQRNGDSNAPASYHYLLGRLLIQQGNLSRALQELRLAATLAPANLAYKGYVALCAAKLGQPAQAARLIAAAKSIGPNNANLVYAEGVCRLLSGSREEARSSFRHAADLSYKWEAPWLALAYASLDSPAQQKTVLDQTESMFPYSPWPHLLKAKLLNSDQELEKALELAPADPRIYAQLLPLCLQQGNCARAQEVWRRMSELGTETEYASVLSCTEQARNFYSFVERNDDISFLIDMLSDSEQEI